MNENNVQIKAMKEDISMMLHIIILMMAVEFKYPPLIISVIAFMTVMQMIYAIYWNAKSKSIITKNDE